jgi:hypothetical protein
MSDDAAEYEYPPEWAPPGAEPPLWPWAKPHVRSGLGYTDDEPSDPNAYPEAWRP